jgi:PAS domain S-box-containing protein
MVILGAKLKRALTGLAIVLFVGTGIAAIVLEGEREERNAAARLDHLADSIAAALAGEAKHQISIGDGLLKELQRDLRSGIGTAHIDRTIEDAPHIESLWHISPDGGVTVLAGRPPSAALRASAAGLLAQSRGESPGHASVTPIGDGVETGVRFLISRALTFETDRLPGGVIGVTVGPQAFEQTFQTLRNSEDDQFYLIGSSRHLLLGFPRLTGEASQLRERAEDLAWLTSRQLEKGHLHRVSSVDGVDRHFSFYTMLPLGLKIIVGLKTEQVAPPWNTDFWRELEITAVFTGVMTVLIGALLLQKLNKARYHRNLLQRLAQVTPVRLWSSAAEDPLTSRRWLGEEDLAEQVERLVPRIHPDDRSRVLLELDEARLKRRPFHVEYRRRDEDGSEGVFLDEGMPQYDKLGRFLGFVGSSIDITDIKEAERALAARELRERAGHLALAEERLDTLVEQAPLGIMVALPSMRVVRVNPGMTRLLGYEHEEMLASSPLAFTLSTDADFERPLLDELLEKGTPYQIKKRCVRKDGSIIWIAISSFAVGRGEERRLVFFAEDITSRQAVEEAVRAGEARLRSYFNQPLVAMYLRDQEGALLHFNGRFADLAGYSEHALAQLSFWEMLDIPERKHIRLLQDDMAKGIRESWLREIDLIRVDGQAVRAVAAESTVRGEEPGSIRIIGLILDISELRKTQGQLERFRSVALASSEAIIIFKPNGEVLFVNKSYEDMLGRRPDLAVGVNFRTSHPFLDQMLVEGVLIPELLAHGRWEGPLSAIGRRGQTLPLWAHAGIVRKPDGHPSFLFLFLQDHSEQARLQADLRQAKEDAEEANAAKTRFLAVAGHDLRQPLQALNLFVGLLASSDNIETMRQIVGKAESSLASFERLLNSVLDMAKLEAGIIKPEISQAQVHPLLAALEEEFKPLAALKGIKLAVVSSHRRLRTDPALLERILRNLVSNAVNHVEKGRILIGCRRRRGQTAIEVLDSGPGIPQDQLGLIFQEFWQGGDSSGGKRGGFGLGLAIVDRLCTLLGHPISVRSQPGRGTVFQIIIPEAQAQTAEAGEPNLDAEPDEPCSILVIDDDEAIRDGMTMLLSSWGHSVMAASDAERAFALLDQKPFDPDIILADHRLEGGQSGIEAIRAVQHKLGRDIPSIIITGDTSPRRLLAVTESGFPLLHKPVAPQPLKAAIAELIGKSRREETERAEPVLRRQPLA